MAVPVPEKSELMASWAKGNFCWPHAALQEAAQNSEGARKERAVSRSLLYQPFFGRNSNLLPHALVRSWIPGWTKSVIKIKPKLDF